VYENSKRGKGNYKRDFGCRDIYKFYKKDTIKELQVDYKTFRNICDEYNKDVVQKVLFESETSKFPVRMGTLRVKKTKMSFSNKNKLRIDWQKSKEFKKRIYHMNEHTSGYKYKFFWKRGIVKNITAYSFIPTRTMSRALATILKDKDRELDYFM
jgi:hypothetical protein